MAMRLGECSGPGGEADASLLETYSIERASVARQIVLRANQSSP